MKPSNWPSVWSGKGRLTTEALALLNRVAREEEVWMYPLSRLAADMGRANLLIVNYIPAADGETGVHKPVGPTSETGCAWVINVATDGWHFVTNEEGLRKRRLRIAFQKLGGKVIPEVPSKPPPDGA